jgi:hypothetical protein
MTQAIYPNDPLVERPVISESFKALADKVTARYGLAPNDPIDWLYALEDMYNEGFNDGLKQFPMLDNNAFEQPDVDNIQR